MLTDPCTCCYLRFAPERFSETDKRPPVCIECQKHVGKADQRDRDHVRDWHASLQSTQRGYETRLERMRDSLDAVDAELVKTRLERDQAVDIITTEFFKHPIGELRDRLESDIVSKEHERVEAAYRLRSRAMVVLWRLDRIHNTVDAKDRGKCKCGTPADKCAELSRLDPITTELDAWEKEQKERLRLGQRYSLPDEHPDVQRSNSSWMHRPPRPPAHR